MHLSRTGLLFALILTVLRPLHATESSHLRVLTINVWSGLDYRGTLRMGEYETKAHRAARFEILVDQIRALDPDLVFLQEVNPTGRFTSRLARRLGYDEIHQVCIAGIKLGPLGIPANLKEGNAILARPSLRLEKWDVTKLSGGFGIYGDALTIHFDETIAALTGRIRVNDTPLFLVSTHLYASRPQDPAAGTKRRTTEIRRLLYSLDRLPKGSPFIVAGDFNAPPDAPEINEFIASGPFRDAVPRDSNSFSWNPQTNQNILDYYASPPNLDLGVGGSAVSGGSNRIDYIFLSPGFRRTDVLDSRITLDSLVNGVQPSDHYGVLAEVDLTHALASAPADPPTVISPPRRRMDLLPILMYDTNTGFGYGAKLFLLDRLHRRESVDLIAFNSTKGERWYRLVFSRPDFALRQGKVYPLALDITADYDKWIRQSFFGLGSASRYDDLAYYTRETVEISALASFGFTRRFVAQVGARYQNIRSLQFDEDFNRLWSSSDFSRVSHASTLVALRYDSRNNFLTPSRGIVLESEVESPGVKGLSEPTADKFSATFRTYSVLFYPRTILALRLNAQQLFGDPPVPRYLTLGGGWSLRGYTRDRFLDKALICTNAEFRFPIYRRLTGIAGMDVGKVFPSLRKADLLDWPHNPVAGLRFDMRTFLIRVDMGFGPETTGLYFNFGHVF